MFEANETFHPVCIGNFSKRERLTNKTIDKKEKNVMTIEIFNEYFEGWNKNIKSKKCEVFKNVLEGEWKYQIKKITWVKAKSSKIILKYSNNVQLLKYFPSHPP